jgi:hypothetical protein
VTCPYGHFDGAYVLGALCPAERTEYESHLARCESCTAAVARLAPVPGLLGRADPAALSQDAPRPPRLSQLIQAVSEQRRRRVRIRRWRLAAAVLGSVVVAIIGTALSLDAPATDPEVSQQMRPVAVPAQVTGWVGLSETPIGTEVRLRCGYPASGDDAYDDSPHLFRLVAVGSDGSSEQLGSWQAATGDEVAVTGMTRFRGDDLARIELRGEDGAALLSYQVP